ncbi:tail completion protein gp17 [Xanthomonas maliensis]|uniref:tail completion protein gp17 n=1 Tax=Xanthomonas maliensis TaxID=1321368 RepID=UPI0003B79702|nr:DUF3168 domain-containing protein [Xanthomonas maliensis]KAB7769361.1 DUF3168 domain-containing protein [Xanthomonas maliensis]
MSFESDFRALLTDLVGTRVYPDVPPDSPVYPLITYQQVGGRAQWFQDQTRPDKAHARIQVNVWADSRAQANALARQVDARIAASSFAAEPYGAFEADYSAEIKKYGTRQDFGLWYADP